MSTSTNLVIAVPAAVAAALSFGTTGALQHRATREVPQRGTLRPQMLVDLIHRPMWTGAIVTNILGVVLQVVALRFGPLLYVQPLLVSALLFAVLAGSALDRRRPDRILLLGATLCVVGLTGFLLVSRPNGGSGQLDGDDFLPLAIGLVVVVAACLAGSNTTEGVSRALYLGLATGVLYGVIAGLIKVVVGQADEGMVAPLQHWALYVVCVVGPMAFLLNQNAYQAEPIASPALAVITTVDPLVGIGVGLLWLGESINAAAWAIALEVLFLALMAVGVLAWRAWRTGHHRCAKRNPRGEADRAGLRAAHGEATVKVSLTPPASGHRPPGVPS